MKTLGFTPFKLSLIIFILLNTFIFYLFSSNGRYMTVANEGNFVTIDTRTGSKKGWGIERTKSKTIVYIRNESKQFDGSWE